MERIRIEDKEYGIRGIYPEREHVLRVDFAKEVPETLSHFTILTEGGEEAGTFTGYILCKREELSVWIANQKGAGSVEDRRPSLAELKAEKKAALDRACSEIIQRGMSVKLNGGEIKHFSLSEHDQLNLFGKLAELTSGTPLCAYHADEEHGPGVKKD